MTWKSDAACQGLTTLFFSGEESDVIQAKNICRVCPAKRACSDLAMSYHEAGEPLLGVWGGKTERERLSLLQRKIDRRSVNGGHGPRVGPPTRMPPRSRP